MGSRSVAISPPGSEDGRLEERPSVAAHPSPLGRPHFRRDHAPAKGVVTPAKRMDAMAKRMKAVFKAPLNDADIPEIVDYLAATYGNQGK